MMNNFSTKIKYLIKNFNDDGFVKINNELTNEEVLSIEKWTKYLQELPEIPGKWMKYFEATNEERQPARIENFINYHNEWKQLLENKITPLVNKITNQEMVLFKDKLNWKLAGGNGFKPHQDHPAWNDFTPDYFVSVAIFVDNNTIENGCLQMVKGEHKKGLLKNSYSEGNGIDEEIVKKFKWEPLLAKKNDIVIFDSFTPHKSEKNITDSSRRIYYFTYHNKKFGNLYDEYFTRKREMLPPDIEKDNTKNYNINNKYNLANPISYNK